MARAKEMYHQTPVPTGPRQQRHPPPGAAAAAASSAAGAAGFCAVRSSGVAFCEDYLSIARRPCPAAAAPAPAGGADGGARRQQHRHACSLASRVHSTAARRSVDSA